MDKGKSGLFGHIWALWPQMCGMVHPDTDKEGGHDIDIPWEILGQDDPLPWYLSMVKGKSG